MAYTRFLAGRLALLILAVSAAASPGLCDGSRLAVGDVVGVTVDGEKEFTKPYQINADGCITLPMVGPVEIEGLNTSDASAVVTKALADVLVNPQVTVAFIERGKMQVFVVGQVTKRGLVEIGVGDRVVQALAQAGYDETADLSRVTVRRGEEIINLDLTKYLSGEDLSVNIPMESGDTVVVSRVDMIGTVMILGQVNKVGSVPIRRGMTFREAMGLIGGVTVEADTDNITLKRENSAELVKLDYKRAMDGDPSADVTLQPGDTIYVPQIETAFFTVHGAVNRPGQYPLKGRLTLTEAVGLAGGAVPNQGDLRKVQVMRSPGPDGAPGVNETIDLTKVMQGTGSDPLVNRGDVIFVATHKRKPDLMDVLQTIIPFGWIFR